VSTKNFVGYLYITPASDNPAQAGLIVGKSVGGSVKRHRLSRQIRHAIAPHLVNLPAGSLYVIRAISGEPTNVIAEISDLTTKLIERAATRKVGA
jgi:ribonuclease P protein component